MSDLFRLFVHTLKMTGTYSIIIDPGVVLCRAQTSFGPI